MVGLPPHHHAIHQSQLLGNLGSCGEASIDHHRQMREVFFQSMDNVVPKWRHFPVRFGREALQPCIARMHDEGLTARVTHRADKIPHHVIAFGFVNADAVLDGDWNADNVSHRLDAISHQFGLGHQAGTKCATLNALAGAATVQVDLVIAPLRPEFGA